MKILFYDTKKYDKESFERALPDFPEITIDYLESELSVKTAALAEGYDAICGFVSSDVSAPVVDKLASRNAVLSMY